MAAKCINLRETFGDRFKVTYEESYTADRGDNARTEDPWLMIIPCQNGHIGPYGDDELFAATTRSGTIAKTLRTLDCVRVWMDGSDGLNVIFNVADAKRVFAVMKPRRKRTLSPEERGRLVAMGMANLKRINSPHVQAAPDERHGEVRPLDVQSHQPEPQSFLAIIDSAN